MEEPERLALRAPWVPAGFVELVERMDDGGTKPSEAAPGSKDEAASTETAMTA